MGKELFSEMGPDGEDALFAFLQGKLRGWQTNLNSFKPLADTGNYPGKDEINDGLASCRKLLGTATTATSSSNSSMASKDDLLDYADQFQELEHFTNTRGRHGRSSARRVTVFNSTGWNWSGMPRRARP